MSAMDVDSGAAAATNGSGASATGASAAEGGKCPYFIESSDTHFNFGPPPKKVLPVPAFASGTTSTVSGHSRSVNSLEWNSTGTMLASGSDDKTARVWAGEGGMKCAHKLEGHQDSVVQLCWDPRTPTSLATLAADKCVRLWDVREPATKSAATIKANHEYINVAWALDGHTIAVGSSVGTKENDVKDCVSLIDARKRKVLKRLKFGYEVNEFCWAPDARHLLLTTENGTVEVLRALEADGSAVSSSTTNTAGKRKDGKAQHSASAWTMEAHTDDCYCIALHATGTPPVVAVGSKDSIVSLWDLEEMICMRTILRHTTPVRCLAFSAQGRYLASSAYDPGVDIADVETTDLVHTIDAAHAMNSLAWHPEKPVLAYAIDAKSAPSNTGRGREVETPPYVRLFAVPEKAGS